jgi:acyl-CoA synthetase (AMP-forming)/AMP-acid ligase II
VRPNAARIGGLIDELGTLTWQETDQRSDALAAALQALSRDDELIVSGGENVYPIEVETTLAAHPRSGERGGLRGSAPDRPARRIAARQHWQDPSS